MNTEAIERINGYYCEVTQEQWKELVRVADEVGCAVGAVSRASGIMKPNKFARHNKVNNGLGVYFDKYPDQREIPFHDFLAKLKGKEQWEPKAGEMVEVADSSYAIIWYEREYIATRGGKCFCWTEKGTNVSFWNCIRPLRPTITRTEAEALMNKRIID